MARYSEKAKKICEVTASRILDRRASPIIWPMPVMTPYWFFKRYFLRELYETLEKLEKKGLQNREIAQLFLTPSRISYLFFYFVDHPLSDCGLQISEREKLIEKLVNYVECYRRQDPFCSEGRDIIWSVEKVKESLNKYKFIELRSGENKELRKTVGKLNALLWLYEEFIHMGRHQFGHQFHGPYTLGNRTFLFVREHVELKPTYVWPLTANLPFDKITSLEVYEGIEIKLNAFNHIESSGNLPDHLKEFIVVANEREAISSLPQLNNTVSQLEGVINGANQQTAEWNKIQWLKKSIEMGYALLKPLKDTLGEDWRPPYRIYSLIETSTKEAEESSRRIIQSAQEIFKKRGEEALVALQELLLKNVYSEGVE